MRRYRPYVEAQLSRGVALKHISRHILGLFHAQPGGRAFRQILSEGALPSRREHVGPASDSSVLDTIMDEVDDLSGGRD